MATSDLTSTSYVTLTRDNYQNVVVSIEENSGFSNCQEGLNTVKVNFYSDSNENPNKFFSILQRFYAGTDSKHFKELRSSPGTAGLLW